MMEQKLKWLENFEEARDISRKTGKPLLLFFHSEHCGGCKAMIAKTLPDQSVTLHVGHRFVPAMFEISEPRHQDLIKKHSVEWTPTFVILDSEGKEGHRTVGYLDPDNYRAELSYGEGQLAFKKGDYATAYRCFADAYTKHPASDIAPEAMYYAGVALYKQTQEGGELKRTYERLKEKYPESTWTKKASVWAG